MTTSTPRGRLYCGSKPAVIRPGRTVRLVAEPQRSLLLGGFMLSASCRGMVLEGAMAGVTQLLASGESVGVEPLLMPADPFLEETELPRTEPRPLVTPGTLLTATLSWLGEEEYAGPAVAHYPRRMPPWLRRLLRIAYGPPRAIGPDSSLEGVSVWCTWWGYAQEWLEPGATEPEAVN